jgi:hypothetical protein
MNNKMTISERIVSSIVYFALIIGMGFYLDNGWNFLTDSSNHYNTLFVASALMLIMGAYITEPYFTKPIDVIAKSFSILLVLFGVSESEKFIFFDTLVGFNAILLFFSIVLIFLQQANIINKFQRFLYMLTTWIAKPEIIFSIVYLATLFSFFRTAPVQDFILLFGIWLLLIFKQPIEKTVRFLIKLFSIFKMNRENIVPIGQAIGCENPYLYTVKTSTEANVNSVMSIGSLVGISNLNQILMVGIVINQKHLLNDKWHSIYLLQDENEEIISLPNSSNIFSNSIFNIPHQVHKLDLDHLSDELQTTINENYLFKHRQNIIGYVSKDSNINKIKFQLVLDSTNTMSSDLGEGTILITRIFGKETLYQIIDGVTTEEPLEQRDKYGFTSVIAKKIGFYNTDTKELNTVRWVPSIYTPVFIFNDLDIEHDYSTFIGTLPNTSYEIPIKEFDSLVTHNTAILGILGIGKSRLTFELIKKVIDNTSVKVICIDISNQYKDSRDGLPIYINSETICADNESAFNSINRNFEYIHTENGKQNPDRSGNIDLYRDALKEDICNFLFNSTTIPEDFLINSPLKVKIYNPDYHKASKGEKIGFNVITTPLSQAEKTRLISEEVFKILMKLPLDETQSAKVLLVFEEAHSLIPEWNSTANPGDRTASNGTGKVILQGRKYGLGSFVVTQRTANISKSILNQCNTIFALRVFDDTGKQFLENYIGSDYANVLPTLEERHCIAVGKALRLKQPIILKLNDMQHIINHPDSAEEN